MAARTDHRSARKGSAANPPLRLDSLFTAEIAELQEAPSAASNVEYAPGIFARLLEQELLHAPNPDYLDGQADISSKMRAILIDWLVEVHMKYHMRRETLFLTVNIIDRYLSIRPVARRKLQLLGVVAMQIAAKFEEIEPPRAKDFAYMTGDTYSKKDILNMEATVLNALDFQIAVPTAAHFLGCMQQASCCDGMHCAFAEYVLETSLLDIGSLRHAPSVLAGASLLLSNANLDRQPLFTMQTEASFLACAEELRVLVRAAPARDLGAVRRRYRPEERFAVSALSIR